MNNIKQYYPIGYYNNNRYRGPIESFKILSNDSYVVDNISLLFKIYNELNNKYDKFKEDITKNVNLKEYLNIGGDING